MSGGQSIGASVLPVNLYNCPCRGKFLCFFVGRETKAQRSVVDVFAQDVTGEIRRWPSLSPKRTPVSIQILTVAVSLELALHPRPWALTYKHLSVERQS